MVFPLIAVLALCADPLPRCCWPQCTALSTGSLPPLGTDCCLCLSLFPDAVVGHGVGASVGTTVSRETSLLLCGVRLSSSEPPGLTPRCHISPQVGRGAGSFPHPPRGPMLGSWFCCPRAGSVRGPQSCHGDPDPPATATRMLSALPAQPAATATPHASEQGEKLPTCAAPGGARLPRLGGGGTPKSLGRRTPQCPLLLPHSSRYTGSACQLC